MNPINELSFAVSDRINDVEVGLKHDPLVFEANQSCYDDDEFRRMVERGTQAWADVPDSAAWVETLREDGQRGLSLAQSAASEAEDTQ